MADSAVPISAGTGTNIDTRTEGTNGNHRQVVVVGDPATNAGVAPVDGTAGLKVDLGTDNDVTVTGTVTVDGSGVTQPVSGTVTANLSATDNAVLDTIDAVLDTINAKLVTGTVIGDVNLGATDNAVLDAIKTAVELIDNAIAGTEMQVDVVGALPAGTNAIGKLAANSGVDIGDVDVTTVTGITVPNGEYETVAASQTDQAIGATGATGDYLSHVTVIPATVSPGVVTIKDNTTAVISFPGGTDSLLTLHPFTIDVRAYSVNGAWKITTGADVSVIAVGNFT